MRDSDIRRLVLHPSLTRPILLWGGDRRLVIALWTIVVLLLFGTRTHPLTLSLALGLGIGGQYALIQAAKADPYWFEIYLRHVRQQPFYPAHRSAHAPPRRMPPSIEG